MANTKTKVKVHGMKDLETDLKNLGVAISREVAMFAKEELTKQYKDVLSLYYQDYEPKVYERTYQLLNDSYASYYKSPHGLISYGGVLLKPDRLSYESGYPGDWVISDYLSGWHGGSIPASFNPYLLLLRRRDYVFSEICQGEAGKELIAKAKGKAKLSMLK